MTPEQVRKLDLFMIGSAHFESAVSKHIGNEIHGNFEQAFGF